MAGSRGEVCSWPGWAKMTTEPSPGVVVLCPHKHCRPEQQSGLAQGFAGVEVVLHVDSSKISSQHLK